MKQTWKTFLWRMMPMTIKITRQALQASKGTKRFKKNIKAGMKRFSAQPIIDQIIYNTMTQSNVKADNHHE
jgi:hypothetical protein